MIRRVITTMVVAASVARAGSALADDAAAPSAIDLFNQAKDAESRGDYEAACTKFAESAKAEVRVGTLARLAQCEERRGSLWKARAYWAEASELANNLHDPRAAHARQELVRVDAQLAGDHAVRADAPGRQPFTALVHIRPGGAGTVVPVKLGEASSPGSAIAAAAVAENAATATPGTSNHVDDTSVHRWSTGRTLALTAGGAGIAALGLGAYFGLTASSKWSDAKMQCGNGCGPEDRANATKREAQESATAADVAFGAAGVLLAAACALWFTETRGHPGQAAPRLRVVPLAGPVTGIVLIAGVGP